MVVLVTVIWVGVAGAGEITCNGIRYTYYNKGMDVADFPKSPQQGTQRSHHCFYQPIIAIYRYMTNTIIEVHF
jgi:hypothetical protein